MRLALDEGAKILRLARNSIEGSATGVREFLQKRGVFVTILTYPEKRLRGCIGFPEATMPLGEAVVEAAKSAATRDPRFPPLDRSESFIVEVSVLTEPELIEGNPAEEFKLGKHGLIVHSGDNYGLLLPQVFTEHAKDSAEALQMTCEKAGLAPDAWKDKDCKVYKFEAQVFIEESPEGNVKEE